MAVLLRRRIAASTRRVRMRLPVRMRWTSTFDQKIELGETIDVSCNGLLVSTKESHTPGITLTFPYDASLSDGQPEILARVARSNELNWPVFLASPLSRQHSQWRFISKNSRTLRPMELPVVTNLNGAAVRAGRSPYPSACIRRGFPGLKRP